MYAYTSRQSDSVEYPKDIQLLKASYVTADFQQYATYWPPMILAFEILENSTKQASSFW
jgi:hypothetical protein